MYTKADLDNMTHHAVLNVYKSLELGSGHILVKVRSGQPHKRIIAPKDHLIDAILANQSN